jgi:hypothetical protein
MSISSPLPKVRMLVISTLQGLLLYALYRAFEPVEPHFKHVRIGDISLKLIADGI